MDSNQCGACQKRFRSGDRKRSLSASPDVCIFVFSQGLIDITQLIDVTTSTNVTLCNSCYQYFYNKMSNVTDYVSTTMDVDYPPKATTCDQAVQTDSIVTSCSSAQCDDLIDPPTPMAPTRVNTILVSDEVPSSYVTLPCYRLANSHKYCGICKVAFGGKGSSSCLTLGDDARMRSIVSSHVFVPIGTRCCSTHVDQHGDLTEQSFDLVLRNRKKMCAVTCHELMELFCLVATHLRMTQKLIEKIQDNPPFDFDHSHRLSSGDYFILTGLDRLQFDDLCSHLPPSALRHSESRSARTAVACLMMKLRLGLSHEVLGVLFSFRNQQTVSRAIQSALSALTEHFVSSNLGFHHVTRRRVITEYTRPLAKLILTDASSDAAILAMDGTYVYVQKSSNYLLQRKLYCMHKGRPLVKMMMIVTTKGYIVSAMGPYYSDSKNNDSMMTKHIIYNDREDVRQWLHKGDVLVVDRGFRDCVSELERFGYKTRMPAFLPKSERQLTTVEANNTRLTTAVRWVVEARNGQIKQFRFFNHVVPNTLMAFIGPAFQLVCAILNKYHSLCIVDTSKDQELARRMLESVGRTNRLKEYVEKCKELVRETRWLWMDASDAIKDFPILSINDFTQMNFGSYQLKQAKSYVFEHLNGDGTFRVRVTKNKADVMRASIQSRHTNAKKYDVWIEYSSTNVTGWYCTCKGGSRVLGCCAHISAIVWFLGYARHHREVMNQRSNSFNDHLTDAVDYSSDVSSSDDNSYNTNSGDDNSDNDSYAVCQ
jgi:hypothetical protein